MPAERKTKKASAIHKPQGSQQEELKKILQKNLLGRIHVHVHTGNYPAIKNRREGERRRRRGECPIGIKLRGGRVRIRRRAKRLCKWTLLD